MTEQLTYDEDIITFASEEPLSGGTDPERGNNGFDFVDTLDGVDTISLS
ncbi:MAG: hypothetical protein VYA14_05620 [Pseudomonadota bacterium]|nr:hypothetical protein [Pseudomonadota bacterium]